MSWLSWRCSRMPVSRALASAIVAMTVAVAQTAYAQANAPGGRDPFDAYADAFHSAAGNAFGALPPTTWAQTDAFVTNSFVGDSLNVAMAKSDLRVDVEQPERKFESKEAELYTSEASEIPCDPDRGCDSDCGWDLGCVFRKGVCEAAKAVAKGLCEAKKAAVGSLSHKKLLTLFMYHPDHPLTPENPAGAPTVSNTILLRGDAHAKLRRATFSGISAAKFEFDPGLNAHVRTTARIKFEPVVKATLAIVTGDLGCLKDEDFDIDQDVQPSGTFALEATFDPPRLDGDQVAIGWHLSSSGLQLGFTEHPIVVLLQSKSSFKEVMTSHLCAVPIIAVTVVGEIVRAFKPDALMSRFRLREFGGIATVAAVSPPVLGKQYVLTPITTDKALGVVVVRRPAPAPTGSPRGAP
jgi:hypothetical protein